MDKHLTENINKKVTGSIKEAIGKVTGDSKLQAEGKADKAAAGPHHAATGAKNLSQNTKKN